MQISQWLKLPQELPTYIFRNYLEMSDLKVLSITCKLWHEIVNRNEVGEPHLKNHGLSPMGESSWMRIYNAYLFIPPYMIAVDISGSMRQVNGGGLSGVDLAVVKACQVAKKITPDIAQHGIDCMVFAELTHSERVFTVEGVTKFFAGEHYLGGSTNFKALFQKIIDRQAAYQSQQRRRPARVTIISDFISNEIDPNTVFSKDKDYRIYFDFCRIGTSVNGGIFQNRFAEHFKQLNLQSKKKTNQISNRSLKRKRQQEETSLDAFY